MSHSQQPIVFIRANNDIYNGKSVDLVAQTQNSLDVKHNASVAIFILTTELMDIISFFTQLSLEYSNKLHKENCFFFFQISIWMGSIKFTVIFPLSNNSFDIFPMKLYVVYN